jgi:acyl-coenzyme A synthetase/AMP-(fatty) acid ligase
VIAGLDCSDLFAAAPPRQGAARTERRQRRTATQSSIRCEGAQLPRAERILFMEVLPRNPTGKILNRELRRMFA